MDRPAFRTQLKCTLNASALPPSSSCGGRAATKRAVVKPGVAGGCSYPLILLSYSQPRSTHQIALELTRVSARRGGFMPPERPAVFAMFWRLPQLAQELESIRDSLVQVSLLLQDSGFELDVSKSVTPIGRRGKCCIK